MSLGWLSRGWWNIPLVKYPVGEISVGEISRGWWKSTVGGRVHLVEESIWWKSPLVEESIWWNSPFGGRDQLVEESSWWKNLFDQCLNGVVIFLYPWLNGVATFFDPSINGVVTFLTLHLTGSRLFSTLDLTGSQLFWGQKMAIRPTPLPGSFWSLPIREKKKNIYIKMYWRWTKKHSLEYPIVK